MRGFRLSLSKRPATALDEIEIADPLDRQFPGDGRIAPVSRLAAAFLDGIEGIGPKRDGFAEGLRVQTLLDKARHAHDLGRWLDLEPASAKKRL
jgi:hypothetical protein